MEPYEAGNEERIRRHKEYSLYNGLRLVDPAKFNIFNLILDPQRKLLRARKSMAGVAVLMASGRVNREIGRHQLMHLKLKQSSTAFIICYAKALSANN